MGSLLKMPDIEVVAGADIIPGKAEAFFKKFGVENARCYNNHKDLIDNEKLDAVSICTYNRQHAEPAIYALEHGVNVMLEKPFTVTTEEAIEVMKAKKKSGKEIEIQIPEIKFLFKTNKTAHLGGFCFIFTFTQTKHLFCALFLNQALYHNPFQFHEALEKASCECLLICHYTLQNQP